MKKAGIKKYRNATLVTMSVLKSRWLEETYATVMMAAKKLAREEFTA